MDLSVLLFFVISLTLEYNRSRMRTIPEVIERMTAYTT
jgi:hypothetical protein